MNKKTISLASTQVGDIANESTRHYHWLGTQLHQDYLACKAKGQQTLVVGINGSQGVGKTTTTSELKGFFERQGLSVAVVSMDDYYLPYATLQEKGKKETELLGKRGQPGTHDYQMAMAQLKQLKGEAGFTGEVHLPVYDKSLQGGAGDRSKEVRTVKAPVDIVIVEGWCWGATPLQEDPKRMLFKDQVTRNPNVIEHAFDPLGTGRQKINDYLKQYQDWFAMADKLIMLKVPSFEVVTQMRLQQEHALADKLAAMSEQERAGKSTMSDRNVGLFVQRFERITRHNLDEMPTRADYLVSIKSDRSIESMTRREAASATV